jgi:hypothetical protein
MKELGKERRLLELKNHFSGCFELIFEASTSEKIPSYIGAFVLDYSKRIMNKLFS